MSENREYVSTGEAASILRLTVRRVVGLCNEGKFEGTVRDGRNWKIPLESVRWYSKNAGSEIRGNGTNSRLPCAVGNTSFTEIAGKCYYVDKTLLIRDLIDDSNMVTLFTRPRRFGKTLAVSMLKTFFEKTDVDTSVYFRDLKIWQCGEKYRSQQGAYPVIMLSFKDAKFGNWDECMEAIRLILRDEFRRHPELQKSRVLGDDDRDYIRRMRAGTLSDVEYARALLNLTRMLAAHHGRKAVILIDEYDTPIQMGYTRGFYSEVIDFMRNLLSGGLKDNEFLAFGVLTGIMRVSKENLFSGLNNLMVNTILDEKYSRYFGFTGEEVEAMADYYGESGRMPEIRKWYDGYRFGNTDIYNPWSVANYFASGCRARSFWANTSDNEIVREILTGLRSQTADELTRAMQGEEIQTALNMEVVYPNMKESPDTVFSFLLVAGYLTLASVPEETEFGTFATLRLPNAEVRRVYNTEILSWISSRQDGSVVTEIGKAIYTGDGEKLSTALRQYMISCISAFDGASEGFYHGMVLGLVASLSTEYHIRSNRESGEGRFDLQLEPKGNVLPGILMEFKAVPLSGKERLQESVAEAIAQIDRMEYTRELEERGVGKIIKYGIAFSGKNVEVKTVG